MGESGLGEGKEEGKQGVRNINFGVEGVVNTVKNNMKISKTPGGVVGFIGL